MLRLLVLLALALAMLLVLVPLLLLVPVLMGNTHLVSGDSSCNGSFATTQP